MTSKSNAVPKFPQAGWLPPASKRMASVVKSEVARIVAARKKAKGAKRAA